MVVGIVGRIPQRAQLSRWLSGAIDGQPVVIVIEGAAGVGKSTLVEWLVGQATEHGAITQQVTVPEQGDVADELRSVIAEADQAMRRGSPQLLVVDDAHWLDEAGQHLVEHLAFRLGTVALTGQIARMCLLLVSRDGDALRLVARLVDEPILRRMTLGTLDDREAIELARKISPGITDRRTIGRLAELSGGNPLTITALADSIALGEKLPPPASTTGTIPVEVAWRARLSTLSPAALRAAVVVALAERAMLSENGAGLLAGADSALAELQTVGAIQRGSGSVTFTHPLLRTTALDLATPEVVADVAGRLLDQIEVTLPGLVEPGTLVRLSAAAHRAGTEQHRERVRSAYDDAIQRGSWSAAGDLAEDLVDTASDLPDRAYWTERLGKARFNELDRDEATRRLIEAADLYDECAAGANADMTARHRNGRAECLLLAMRTDFTRSGRRRHQELDGVMAEIVSDESVESQWRAQAAAILAEAAYASPEHERREQHVARAQSLLDTGYEPLTANMVHFATGLHRLAVLDLDGAAESFTLADKACRDVTDSWWFGGDLSRRGLVALVAGDPMAATGDATAAADHCVGASNWAEHGVALAVRSVAMTRLGRFTDADNDTESAFLSARRADATDPFSASLSTAIWRRAVRGDEVGVVELVAIAVQHQMYIPFAEFVAVALLHGVDRALDEKRPRWTSPRRGISFRNLSFYIAQLDAAVLAGNLETVDELFTLFEPIYERGVRASNDWPLSMAVSMASAAIELGDPSVEQWLERAHESAMNAGSVLEIAMADLYSVHAAFVNDKGGQAELDLAHRALETLDALGAPLLARLHRERLTSVAGRLGAPSGRLRTVMFTDIVDSTRLMASAGNAAWAVVLGEHHRIVRSVVGRYRGSIMTATGDGFAAWFEQPSDAATAAVALHEAIRDAALVVPGGTVSVRVGLATGSVFDLGTDLSGMAVAEAARVMSTAGSGDTHLSTSVIDGGLDPAYTSSVGVHSLKGLPAPLEIFALVSKPLL